MKPLGDITISEFNKRVGIGHGEDMKKDNDTRIIELCKQYNIFWEICKNTLWNKKQRASQKISIGRI